jgi:hypothetical protein
MFLAHQQEQVKGNVQNFFACPPSSFPSVAIEYRLWYNVLFKKSTYSETHERIMALKIEKCFIPVSLFIIFVIVYSMTAYPGPGGRINYNDSVWKMLLPTSDKIIPHVTGFPLYIFITKVFYYVMPFDSLFSRITAISVCFGALTIAFVYLLAFTLSANKTGSILASLVMGFSYTFWTQSTEAEIYSLNAFFIVIVAYLFIKFYQTRKPRYLLWGNFLYALSFGNHLMVVWMLPPLIYLVYKTDKKIFFNKKVIFLSLLFIILGMVPYFFLYLRFCNVGQPSLSHFFDYLTGGAWKGMAMFVFNIFEIFENRVDLFLTLLNHQFFLPGIVASLFGISLTLFTKKDRTPFLFLVLVLLFQLFFILNYGIYDIEVYFIPVYIILAIFISLLFLDRNFLKVKIGFVVSVIILQLVFNLGRGDIRVLNNERLEKMLFLIKNTPPGSLILVPKSFERNGDYKMLARYITYTKEYGNYKVVYQEEDTRIPYSIIRDKGRQEYYLTSRLDILLKKLKEKGQGNFYFIGTKNRKQLIKDGNFIVTDKLCGKGKRIGMAIRKTGKTTGSNRVIEK